VSLDPGDVVTQLTEQIIGAAIDVHRQRHVHFQAQVTLPITYGEVFIDRGYRVDLLVEECVIVEVKAVQTLTPLCAAQLITYLKLKRCPVGLLLNFNVAVLRHGVSDSPTVLQTSTRQPKRESGRMGEVWPCAAGTTLAADARHVDHRRGCGGHETR
jgi:hypothetical protein